MSRITKIFTEEVDGCHVRVIRKGSGNETLLFLHGLGLIPNLYEVLLEQLSQVRTVLAPKIYGMDGMPTNFDDATELSYRLVKLYQPQAVVGHSVGGLVAVLLAEGVDAAVGIAPSIMVSPSFKNLMSRFMKLTVKTMKEAQLGKDPLAKAIKDSIGPLFARPLTLLSYGMGISRYTYRSLTTGNAVGIVIGRKDELFWDQRFEAEVNKYLPNAKSFFPDAFSHTAPLAAPDEIATKVEDCLAQCKSA